MHPGLTAAIAAARVQEARRLAAIRRLGHDNQAAPWSLSQFIRRARRRVDEPARCGLLDLPAAAHRDFP